MFRPEFSLPDQKFWLTNPDKNRIITSTRFSQAGLRRKSFSHVRGFPFVGTAQKPHEAVFLLLSCIFANNGLI